MGSEVRVRSVVERTELAAVSTLLARVWSAADRQAPLALLCALSHAGGSVLGAYRADRLVGAAVGFLGGEPTAAHLHSHIVGVDRAWQGRGVGTALKLHQRQWCLDRGISVITWTFDPLMRRNAVFNIARLGAQGVAYYADFYGPMDDSYNAGVATDRVLVRWELTNPATPPEPDDRIRPRLLDISAAGEPRLAATHREPSPDAELCVRVPDDLHRERGLLTDWRMALRSVMQPLLIAGYRWTGVTPAGWYVLTPPAPTGTHTGVHHTEEP